MEKLSIRLQQYMQIYKISQLDILAKVMPLCEKYHVELTGDDLAQYLSGTVIPGTAKLTILSQALNVRTDWLVGYDVPMDPKPAIITKHEDILDENIYAINTLLQGTDMTIKSFANQIQLEVSDSLYKLSPVEVANLIQECRKQIQFGVTEIINNRFYEDIPVQGTVPDLSECQ